MTMNASAHVREQTNARKKERRTDKRKVFGSPDKMIKS